MPDSYYMNDAGTFRFDTYYDEYDRNHDEHDYDNEPTGGTVTIAEKVASNGIFGTYRDIAAVRFGPGQDPEAVAMFACDQWETIEWPDEYGKDKA